MMVGETVALLEPVETGRDAYNSPVAEWHRREVENVLVAPADTSDVSEPARDGDVTRILLYWPKADGSPNLAGCRVEVRGLAYRICGAPFPFDPALCPTDWNMTAEAVREDG